MQIEHRAVAEIRSTGRTLYGTAAPFNVSADIAGAFVETILPGAFRATLSAGSDIRALADHRPDALLGRTRSGSLKLIEGRAGLTFELSLPDTQLGRDVAELARRGDLGGVSIGFSPDDERWPTPRNRELRAVTLHEISVLTGADPAYDRTSVALRARALDQTSMRLRRLRLAVL